jgi:phage-related protein
MPAPNNTFLSSSFWDEDLYKLPKSAQSSVRLKIAYAAQFSGYREKVFKPLTNEQGLSEIIAGDYRVLCFPIVGKRLTFVMVSAFLKQSYETPKQEIARAHARRKNLLTGGIGRPFDEESRIRQDNGGNQGNDSRGIDGVLRQTSWPEVLSGTASFPLALGKNAKSIENKNVQKYVNLQFWLMAKALGGTSLVSLKEDGTWGSGTDVALWTVVYYYQNKKMPTPAEISATKSPRVTVTNAWYTSMLAQMRTAGWTPYGESPTTTSSTPTTTTTTTPSSVPASSAPATDPGHLPSKDDTKPNTALWAGALLATGAYAFWRGESTGNYWKPALQIAPLTLGGAAAYTVVKLAAKHESSAKAEKKRIEAAIQYEIANGATDTWSIAQWGQWADQIHRAVNSLTEQSSEVVSIIYKVRNRLDFFRLTQAYGMRSAPPQGDISAALVAPITYLITYLNPPKKNLGEALSLLKQAQKDEASRHLAQFFKYSPIV